MIPSTESKGEKWRAYKHWIFDSKNNHVFILEEMNFSNHIASLIVDRVNEALRSERERVIEECAEIVKKWHYKKGGYTVLEEEILKLKGSK